MRAEGHHGQSSVMPSHNAIVDERLTARRQVSNLSNDNNRELPSLHSKDLTRRYVPS